MPNNAETVFVQNLRGRQTSADVVAVTAKATS